MKKKNTAKLRLSRETLQVMSGGHLNLVRGAAQSIDPEGCDDDLTIPISGCELCGGATLQSCQGQNGCYSGAQSCVC